MDKAAFTTRDAHEINHRLLPSFLPSVGDYIADGRFRVHKRIFKGSNLVLLDVILDDEEEDPRVLSGHEVNL